MTESVQAGRVILLPNGVTTTFALPFRVLTNPDNNNSNVVVKPYTLATGVIGAALIEGTDYTVSGIGGDTGSITTIGGSSPWANTSALIAYTDTPVQQNLDYVDNDPMPAADGTDALDWLCEIARNHKDRLDRSLKFTVAMPLSGVNSPDVPVPPLNGATIYWDTTLGWTWTTVSLATLQAQAASIAAITSQIVTVAAISAQVVSVAGNAGNINTVAGSITYVNAVGANIAAVAAVAGDLTNIDTVAADLTNINLTAGSIANVNAVATDLTKINAVYAQLTPIEGVYADLTQIVGVYNDLTQIVGVYNDLTQIVGVYNDLTAINAVAADLTNINSVAANLTNINAVVSNATNINTVAGISANVTTVAGMSANIATVVANMATITNAANNIPKANLSATVAPTVNNDNTQGYQAGSQWVDTTHNALYFATSAATGAANWIAAFSASSLATLSDVTITSAANNDTLQYNGSKWVNNIPATARTALGLGSMATQAASAVAISGGTITGLGTPSANSDAATKSYVDAATAGLSGKGSCAVATTANLTGVYLSGVFTYTATGVDTIDGIALTSGMRVLLKNQSTGSQNGIYSVTTPGSVGVAGILTRTSDYNTTAEVQAGTYTVIEQGTANAGLLYINTTSGTVTLDTTSLVFTALSVQAIAASSLTGTTLAPNVVTSSLTTVGTIATGVWQGTAVGATYGGTGINSSASTGIAQVAAGTWSVSTALPSATTATTQSATDNSTKVATTAYVDQVGGYNNQTGTTIAIGSAQRGQTINFTGASACVATLASNAGITGGSSWWAILCNSSAVNLTLQATTSTVDGVAGASGYIMYPGEIRLIDGDGTNYKTQVLHGFQYKVTSSGSWKIPPGYKEFRQRIWAGGQSGAARSTTGNAGGGAGGPYMDITLDASKFVAVGSTETLTVAGTAAGVSGNTAGNISNFSSVTINGTTFTCGVTIAAICNLAAATAAVSSAAAYGSSAFPFGYSTNGGGEVGGSGGDVSASNVPEYSINIVYASANHAGGGGGACASTAGGVRTGGSSLYGGNGGAGGANTGGNGTNGTVPSGGGGGAVQAGTSGSGAGGQIIVSGNI